MGTKISWSSRCMIRPNLNKMPIFRAQSVRTLKNTTTKWNSIRIKVTWMFLAQLIICTWAAKTRLLPKQNDCQKSEDLKGWNPNFHLKWINLGQEGTRYSRRYHHKNLARIISHRSYRGEWAGSIAERTIKIEINNTSLGGKTSCRNCSMKRFC